MKYSAIKLTVTFAFGLLATSCGGSDGGNTGAVGTTTVSMVADFQTTTVRQITSSAPNFRVINTCPTPAPTTDVPGYLAGLDCDADGGLIQYITPASFKVAFKRIDFVRSDGSKVNIVPDTGTLANAEVYDLSSSVTLSSTTIPEGVYPTVEAEVYYYELLMPINVPSTQQSIRIYLSDDNFTQEGNLGHHQGDITFIDATGAEQGWVPAALQWTTPNLTATRGVINGAGGTDPETGHLRGLFGDATLWNHALQMQGNNQDIYKMVSAFTLAVGSSDQQVTFSFNVKDSWFYEDFDANQVFNPCDATSDACAVGAEWAPLFAPPEITVQ